MEDAPYALFFNVKLVVTVQHRGCRTKSISAQLLFSTKKPANKSQAFS